MKSLKGRWAKIAVHLFFALSTPVALSQVEIAFFEKRDSQGRLVELEKGGRFFHVAIRYQEQWLHTDSFRGVVLEREVSEFKYGKIAARLINKEMILDEEVVEAYLGLPYDFDYDWSDEGLYCSELIAKLLGFEPKAMNFSGDYWKNKEGLPEGKLGVSPDGIYQRLIECETWLLL